MPRVTYTLLNCAIWEALTKVCLGYLDLVPGTLVSVRGHTCQKTGLNKVKQVFSAAELLKPFSMLVYHHSQEEYITCGMSQIYMVTESSAKFGARIRKVCSRSV